MTVQELKRAYQQKYPDGHFFDRETLSFFGEKLSAMKVLDEIHEITDSFGNHHRCYVLATLQEKAPFGPQVMYFYFDVDTIDDVYCTNVLGDERRRNG